MAAELIVHAPIDGWVCALEEVPDAAFAARMVGEGLAIDPTGMTVCAPFDGVVSSLARTGHAVSVRSDQGAEVLIHLGLETVALEGQGFTAHVTAGTRVKTGDPLLTLDLEVVAAGAKSLISPILLANEGEVRLLPLNRLVVAGEPIMTVHQAAIAVSTSGDGGAVLTRTVRAPLPHGLHARPASRLAAAAKSFDARVRLTLGERSADAASLTAMMTLGLKDGDELILSASGPQAEAALEAIAALIASGLGEGGDASHAASAAAAPAAGPAAGEDGELIFSGVTAAPGLVIGRAVRLRQAEIETPEHGRGVMLEQAAMQQALSAVRRRIEASVASGGSHRRAILAAHLAFLDDPGLIATAQEAIEAGRSAGFAWRTATQGGVALFRSLGDARTAERADDLMDLERQVLVELSGEAAPAPVVLGAGSVILADDLLPSQLIALDAVKVAGLCTARGGPTSHVAILAAAMGVPALVAVGPGLDRVEDGALVVLDADGRRLVASPSAARQARAQSAAAARDRRRAEARALAAEDCRTADGVRIEVFANLGDVAEAAPAVAGGAEGCGLLRTEFLFLERQSAPTEDEQLAQYQAIADALDGRPLVIRTLDAGGDKPLPYLPMPHEDNPALGLRGVRTGLHRPDLLLTQLRAVCRVRSSGTVAVMLPMIASASEVRQVRALLDIAASETDSAAPLLGVMIETPAAAMTADLLAPHIDFVSVGTNDLTQYALAMDRQNAHLAAQLDSLHPAVLRLIAQTAAGAADTRWIGVCGGLASDVLAAPILIGLGVTELSATPSMVAEIKALLRGLTLANCRQLAGEALTLDSVEAVRALADERLAALLKSRVVGAVA
ncbi:phosphoenolpyruvate--protein phosphotransferase [uncultured Brevundimonas sp.]|uniref:phosphoenolpyruvate--protein phosphotransferase n=1 Tax=uncultured Brevundimonas sp. TaxID=213418 RepID=UPI0025E73D06|nr:phosphoenolpyruvate--protein phosphotransferase [uncultured Brevundimonas sp.]